MLYVMSSAICDEQCYVMSSAIYVMSSAICDEQCAICDEQCYM